MSDDVGPASELNREITRLLVEAGERFGFDPHLEYRVPGGRLDVVWTWTPPVPMPGLAGPVPVVGFEVESSWRTRKHLKGDYLNLADAGVAFGVIVIAGDDARDDSLRRFADTLVNRPGPHMAIWTAADVHSLAAGHPGFASAPLMPGVVAAPETLSQSFHGPGWTTAPAGKYAPLGRWLNGLDQRELQVSFEDVEAVLGFPLPPSCRVHSAHWHGYDGSAVARAIADAGWRATAVNLEQETITFVRAQATSPQES